MVGALMGGSVVYAVLAHHEPEQLGRLVRRLSRRGSTVVVHVNARADLAPFEGAVGGLARFTTPRLKVTWGGYSLARAMVNVIEHALVADPSATHVQLLSGVDYPARPESDLEEHLVPGRSYVNFYPMLAGSQFDMIPHTWCFRDQYAVLPGAWDERAYRFVDRLNRRLPRRTPPVTLYRGSAWMCLSRPAAEYVVAATRDREHRRVMRYLKTINVPDEIAVQTLLGNSPLATSLEGWEDGAFRPEEKRVYHHYIDWDPDRENPAVLDLDDLPAIRASGQFFVRKVFPARSARLLDALDSAAADD
jgi:hypothetical protein